ncbi:hypothetical protein J1605_000424 [Eschrichtius robustus]|uniref:Uncharacterized protein n=1 Tax=Eschrichtius robustus TaxID=9764 RepID=A0AB34HAP2_ESCRO|nr:hypothetical protein J1605_000424 [Eschrichtius robustus]
MLRLRSCGSRAQLLRGMWDLPRPGLEPASPALAGRLLTTVPPGKPHGTILLSEHRLSSCGTQTYLLRSMWDLPGPGIEPVSPALAGGFLTTVPPGKSPMNIS